MPKKTVGFWDAIAVAAAACGVGSLLCAPAMGATCNPGYYLNNGECIACGTFYYCPGDDLSYACPKTDVDTEHVEYYWYWSPHGLQDSITGCRVQWKYETFGFSCAYGDTGYAGSLASDTTKCMINVNSCPAGYWCPYCDSNTNYWTSSYDMAANSIHCGPVGHGYYSPAGDVFRTICPDETSTRIPNATGLDDCVSLCGTGITQIHAGGFTAPIWAERHTTPALVIRTAGGLCYGDLKPGTGPGINMRVNDTIFHIE